MLPIHWHRPGKDLNFHPHYLLWKIKFWEVVCLCKDFLYCFAWNIIPFPAEHILTIRLWSGNSAVACAQSNNTLTFRWYWPSQMGCSIFAFWYTGIQGDPEASVFRSEWKSNGSDSASTKWRFQLKEHIRRERPGWRGKTRMKKKKEWRQRTWVHEVIQAGNQPGSYFSHCENGGKQ